MTPRPDDAPALAAVDDEARRDIDRELEQLREEILGAIPDDALP